MNVIFLYNYIYKMTWTYDFFKLSKYHLNQVPKKLDVSNHVSYTIPVKTINNVLKNPMR